MVEPIKIIYRDGAYRVNRPNWDGGEVVMASHYAALEAQLAEANKALEEIENIQFPGWEAQTAVDHCVAIARRAREAQGGK